jgi:hypothetical protein
MSSTYWKLFCFLWTPIRLVARFLWTNEWIPLGRCGPYVLGAAICSWPIGLDSQDYRNETCGRRNYRQTCRVVEEASRIAGSDRQD